MGELFNLIRAKLDGSKSYLIGIFCVVMGVGLIAGKLMVDGMEDLSWDSQIAPWFALGFFIIANAAKGNKAIEQNVQITNMVGNLAQTLGEHKEQLDIVQKSITIKEQNVEVVKNEKDI